MNTKTATTAQLPCFECESGTLVPIVQDYATQLHGFGEIIIPNVPMERCNVCGDTAIADEGHTYIDNHIDKLTNPITPLEVAHLLEKYSLTQKQAAQITGYGEKNICRWLNGKSRPSSSVTNLLRLLIANSNAFEQLKNRYWESTLPQERATFTHEQPDESEKTVLQDTDYNQLAKIGLVQTTRKRDQRRTELCILSGTTNLLEFESWCHLGANDVAAFKDTQQQYSAINGGLWIQLGERAARALPVSPFSRDKLENAVPVLRELTRHQPHTVFKTVQNTLADAGVALVVIPKLKGSAYRGCTRLIDPSKAMIAHSLKYKNASQFWRVLFHEIAHLILHISSPDQTFTEYEDQANDLRENEADQWADEILVQTNKRIAFLARHKKPTIFHLQRFAKELKTSPEIAAEIINSHSGQQIFDYSYLRMKKLFPVIPPKAAEEMWNLSKSLIKNP